MAWRVQIAANDQVQDLTGWKLHLLVKYYEDTDARNTPNPTVFLWEKDFYFNGDNLTLQIVQDAVFAEGKQQRTAYNTSAAARSLPALSIGSTYQVP